MVKGLQYYGFGTGWAQEAVEWAANAGIINGKPGNLFDPKGNATRAEVAAIIQRYIESVENK